MLDEVKSFERTGGVHYYAGMAQGIYEEEGIRLRVLSGIPSYVSAKYVSLEENALDSFGQADTALTLLAMTEDLPVRCVAGMLANVIGIVSLGSNGVKKPKDLEGKKIGLAMGTGESMMLPLLAELNGVDFGKVKVVNVGPGSGKTLERGPRALLEGRLDAYAGYLAGSLQHVKYLAEQRNEQVSMLKYSDFGIESYGFNLLCHQRMLDENEDLVRRFLRATQRSVAWVVDHPDESASLMQKHVPDMPGAIARGLIRAIRDAAVRPETRQNGMGWMSPQVWVRLQDQLYEHDYIIAKTPIDRIFTNQYLDRVVPQGST